MPKWIYYTAAFLLSGSVGGGAVYLKGLDLNDVEEDGMNISSEADEKNSILDRDLLDIASLYNGLNNIRMWSFVGNKPRVTVAGVGQRMAQPMKKATLPSFLGLSTVGKVKYAIFELNSKVERISTGEMLSNGFKLISIKNGKVSISMSNGDATDLQLFKSN